MLKKIAALMLALFAFAAFAAVDVNKATQAELESVKGIGPSISGKILDERKKSSFKDWQDFIDRVKGVGEGNAAKFSAEGLTVSGATFKGVAAAPAKAETAKPAAAPAKAEAAKPAAAPAPAAVPTPAAAPAPVAAPAKAAPMSADEKKAMAKKEKEEKKAAAAAKDAEAKKAKADKAAAAKAAKEGKPADAAASAAKK